MSTKTSKYGLEKPASTDSADITVLNGNADKIDNGLVMWGGTTTNVLNVYSIASPTILALVEGAALAFKCNSDSTGAVSLNWDGKGAKPVVKANGSVVSSWKKDGIYTVRFGGINFTLQGESAGGNAVSGDLLLNKTAESDSGPIVGSIPTMPTDGFSHYISTTASVGVGGGSATSRVFLGIPFNSFTGLSSWVGIDAPTFTAENFRHGVSSLGGLVGNFTGDATAATGDMITGKTAGVKGSMIAGSMASLASLTKLIANHGSSMTVTVDPTDERMGIVTLPNELGGRGCIESSTKISGQLWGLIPSNIKAGEVVGRHPQYGSGGMTGTFTSDANVIPKAMLSGYSGYKNGSKVYGEIPMLYQTALSAIRRVDTTIFGKPLFGCQDGSTSEVYLSDANLLSNNIRLNTPLFGLVGSMPDGTGLKRMARGTGVFVGTQLSITGIAFRPTLIIVEWVSGGYGEGSVYRMVYNVDMAITNPTGGPNIVSSSSTGSGVTSGTAWSVGSTSFAMVSFSNFNGVTATWKAYE